MGLYDSNRQIRLTVVDGSIRTGLFAVDGSWNIVLNAGTGAKLGAYHVCGALNATVTTDPFAGYYSANNSMNVILNASGTGYTPVDAGGNRQPTYFFSATGSDANDGRTVTTPKQTLTAFNALPLTSADYVAFKGGDTFAGTMTIPAGGSAASPLLITSYGTGQATISAAINTNGIQATDFSYITIVNLNVVGAGGTSGIGIALTYTAVDGVSPKIINCNVSGFAGDGIKVLANEPRIVTSPLISGCVVDACTVGQLASTAGINLRGTSGAQSRGHYNVVNGLITGCLAKNNPGVAGHTNWCGSGIYLANATNCVVTNCVADNNGTLSNNSAGPSGIWMFDSIGCTIQYCESKNTKSAGGDGGGYDLDGACVNCILQYNYSHDNVGYGFMSFTFDNALVPASSNNTIRYNISARDGLGGMRIINSPANGTTGQAHNNVIYLSNATGVCLKLEYNGAGYNWKINNNIFVRENAAAGDILLTSGAPTGTTLTGNDYWTPNTFRITWSGVAHATYAAWQAASNQELILAANVGFNANPVFLGSQSSTYVTGLDNFRIQETSPVFNTAVNIFTNYAINPGTVDYFGNPISTSGPWCGGIGGSKSAVKSAVITTTGLQNYTIPSDFVTLYAIEGIGAGGSVNTNLSLGAGGGGGYFKSTAPSLAANQVVRVGVGAAVATSDGGDTFFNASSLADAVSRGAGVAGAAQGGKTNANTVGGLGGQASAGVGQIKYSGGNGGSGTTGFAAGGGGAAGSFGAGANGADGGLAGAGCGGGGGANSGLVGITGAATIGGNGGKGPYGFGAGSGTGTIGNPGANGGGGGGAGNGGGTGGIGGSGSDWNDAGTLRGAGGGAGGGSGASGTETGGLYGGGAGGKHLASGANGVLRFLYHTALSA